MTNEAELFEIDINKKYVLSFTHPIPDMEMAKMKKSIGEWLKSDCPFLMLFGDVKLVKVSEPSEYVDVTEEQPICKDCAPEMSCEQCFAEDFPEEQKG